MVTIYLGCQRVTVYGDAFNQQRESAMFKSILFPKTRADVERSQLAVMIGYAMFMFAFIVFASFVRA